MGKRIIIKLVIFLLMLHENSLISEESNSSANINIIAKLEKFSKDAIERRNKRNEQWEQYSDEYVLKLLNKYYTKEYIKKSNEVLPKESIDELLSKHYSQDYLDEFHKNYPKELRFKKTETSQIIRKENEASVERFKVLLYKYLIPFFKEKNIKDIDFLNIDFFGNWHYDCIVMISGKKCYYIKLEDKFEKELDGRIEVFECDTDEYILNLFKEVKLKYIPYSEIMSRTSSSTVRWFYIIKKEDNQYEFNYLDYVIENEFKINDLVNYISENSKKKK